MVHMAILAIPNSGFVTTIQRVTIIVEKPY
jgi:hypothetical protein